MKIGIMTLFFNYNYGATLQAFALQTILKDAGYDVEDIWYYREIDSHPINESGIRALSKQIFKRLKNLNLQLEKILQIKKIVAVKKNVKIREGAFLNFIDSCMSVSERRYSGHRDIGLAANEYDIFICGSDNIWNKNLLDTAFFLDFVPDEKKKIAYAPGMSTSELSESQETIIVPLVNRFDYLSVRESSGCSLLSQLTGRKIFHAVDPTLLLTKSEWRNYEREVNLAVKDYIFCFFVGDSVEARKNAAILAEYYNLPIVTLPYMSGTYLKSDDGFGNYPLYDIDPAQFLWLIDHAKYVCTDSFHGTVFSILFEKEFYCYRRFFEQTTKSLNYRIDSLLDDLGIKGRIIEGDDLQDLPVAESLDFVEINSRLNSMRKTSLNYLFSSLNQ